MEYVSSGTRLFCHMEGDGPAVVLLHPTPCDHRFWLPAARSLAGKYRVLIPDLRGHGGSEPGDGPITVGRLAADVLRLLDQIGVDRGLFAGCSVGGYTLYEIWRQAPSRVDALAFCCSRPQADSAAGRARREAVVAKIKSGGTGDFILAQLSALIGPTARKLHPERIAEVRAMMETVRPETLIAIQRGLAVRPDSVATARTFTRPVFVLAGGEDALSPSSDMKLLAETIRNNGMNAEYHELADAGHLAPWEQPERVGGLLRRFFDSVVG